MKYNSEFYELDLFDRIEKIKEVNNKYDLEHNAYISFSGGKDSTCLSHLVDLALPNNKIPRLFINTGIEYIYIYRFVKELSLTDDRIVIINSGKNIKKMLEEDGYPFKSKQHSHNVSIYQHNGMTTTNQKYLYDKDTRYQCPSILRYQFTDKFKIPLSDKCCMNLKKKPAREWEIKNKRNIVLTGMRREEGGSRNNIDCVVFSKDKHLKKFHPLAPLQDEFIDLFVEKENIKLCKLYYPPYNFDRTGCKGCPFSLNLQEQLDTMERVLPNERKQCEFLWKPIYDEYRRLNYRLKSERQMTIDDFLEKER